MTGAKSLIRIVAELGEQARADGQRADVDHQQRIAVGLRVGDLLRADIAAGAGLVLDQDGLAPHRGQLLPDGRARTSEVPPGAKGTMMRIGLAG